MTLVTTAPAEAKPTPKDAIAPRLTGRQRVDMPNTSPLLRSKPLVTVAAAFTLGAVIYRLVSNSERRNG